jgi:hypothetical protein
MDTGHPDAEKPPSTALVATAPPDEAKPKKLRRVNLRKPIKMAAKSREPRAQSAIAFPYMDLENAISVARAMLDSGGLALTREQVAGALRQSPSSGNFILKMGAARQFGVIEQVQGKYQLTQLGFAITNKDEATERAARAEAFLNVPLYRRAYDEFRGRQLPPRPHGLESAFVHFGVAPKQKDTARQIFEKSARQAGFFNVDPDRLIEPILGAGVAIEGDRKQAIYGFHGAKEADTAGPVAAIKTTNLDALIQGLIDRLPKAGEKWDIEKRARWLQVLASNFDIVYASDDGEKVIVVEVKKGNLP